MSKINVEYGDCVPQDIPGREFYREAMVDPLLKPWLIPSELTSLYSIVASTTLVDVQGVYSLHRLTKQCLHIPGEFWECGVFRGGTAELTALMMENQDEVTPKTLRLFDTFEGMPKTSEEHDLHKEGDFSNTSWSFIQYIFASHPFTHLHKGFIPDTFKGLEESKIAFMHCDLDIYQSILDCLAFCYPRMSRGGVMLFDDYGTPTCPGARKAIDEFFSDKPEQIFYLSMQAFVVKL